MLMASVDTTKKPARHSDWHRADIKAALEKKGWSVRSLSITSGYEPGSLKFALHRPWPAAEAKIAEAIGVPAPRIWPSRYHRDGTPKSGRGERGLGRIRTKGSTAASARNVDQRGAR